MKKIAKILTIISLVFLATLYFEKKAYAQDFTGYFKYCPRCGADASCISFYRNEQSSGKCGKEAYICSECNNVLYVPLTLDGHTFYITASGKGSEGYYRYKMKCDPCNVIVHVPYPSPELQAEKEAEGIYWEDPITVAEHNHDILDPTPDPEPSGDTQDFSGYYKYCGYCHADSPFG